MRNYFWIFMHFEAGLTNARIINSGHMIVSLNLLLQARCSIRSTIYPGDTETYQQVLLILGCLTLQCHASILGREPFWEENVFNRERAGGEAHVKERQVSYWEAGGRCRTISHITKKDWRELSPWPIDLRGQRYRIERSRHHQFSAASV